MSEKAKLSVEAYKGTRDFYPEDQFIQDFIFSVWRKVAQSYGYAEYNSSILEETALYKAKSGEEIVNDQTYSFTDRGGRDVTIRPEMTPTVARMVAQKRKELSFPLRWFSIPNLFRYERPQRGRLREHWQLNVDIFGVEGIDADLEIIKISNGIMKAFGAKDDQYKICINSRKFINFLFGTFLKLSEEESYKVSKLLDRMHKISGEDFHAQALEILGDPDRVNAVVTVTRSKSLDDLPEEIKTHESVVELRSVIEKLAAVGVVNVVFEMSIVRGFDYYTGIVFEVYDTSPVNPRALFGGGRYDDLVGIFGVEKVTGVGFGMGDVTIHDFLETYNLLPEYKPTIDLYICIMGNEFTDYASGLAEDLRLKGLRVAVDFSDRKVASQVKSADKQKIPFVIVIGEEEMKNEKFKLKNMVSGDETEVSRKEIVSVIHKA
jgi:histidyl-tRNA synthetase